MKKEFTHYGQKVLLAGNRSRYEMILEKNNVEYIPLPILSKTYRVVKYNNKYAVILTKETEDDLESVIVTEALPDDLNIDALIVDVFSQLRGEKPAKMPTKAMIILHDAEKLLQEKQSRTGTPLTGDSYFAEMAGALEIYGGTEYLKTLPHDDIAQDYWNQLMAAKPAAFVMPQSPQPDNAPQPLGQQPAPASAGKPFPDMSQAESMEALMSFFGSAKKED